MANMNKHLGAIIISTIVTLGFFMVLGMMVWMRFDPPTTSDPGLDKPLDVLSAASSSRSRRSLSTGWARRPDRRPRTTSSPPTERKTHIVAYAAGFGTAAYLANKYPDWLSDAWASAWAWVRKKIGL